MFLNQIQMVGMQNSFHLILHGQQCTYLMKTLLISKELIFGSPSTSSVNKLAETVKQNVSYLLHHFTYLCGELVN